MPSIELADVDIHIHYEECGSGPPVVLIHGLGSSGGDWAPQVEALAPYHRVIALDLRGHGSSSRPEGPYVMTDFSRDTAAVIRRLCDAPPHVIGISLGGMVAFQLAVDEPELVRSLAIVNSGPEVVPRKLSEHALVWSRLAMAALFPMTTVARSIAGRLFPKPEQQTLRDTFVDRMGSNDKAAYRAAFDAIIGWTILDRIGEIACPTLVVSGDRDYTPVDVKARYAARMADARVVVVEDSGHATPMDQPERLNGVLTDFLRDVEAAGSSSERRVA